VLYVTKSIVNGADSWVGFLGSYLGAITGGFITLYVMYNNNKENRRNMVRQERIKELDSISILIAEFCAGVGETFKSIMTNYENHDINETTSTVNYQLAEKSVELEIKCAIFYELVGMNEVSSVLKEISNEIEEIIDDYYKHKFSQKDTKTIISDKMVEILKYKLPNLQKQFKSAGLKSLKEI